MMWHPFFSSHWKYVDDLTVGESASSSGDIAPSNLQSVMDGTSDQASRDHMSLNISKSALMQIGFSYNPPPPLVITVGGQQIAQTPP